MDEAQGLTILGISGSLRYGSLNTAILRAAIELSPPGMEVVEYGAARRAALRRRPGRHGTTGGRRRPAAAHPRGGRAAYRHARVQLLDPGCPQERHRLGVAQPTASPLQHKHVAIMGAASGNLGTVRAQLALRQMLVWTDSVPVVKPEIYVFGVAERFDESGRLCDQATGAFLVELL